MNTLALYAPMLLAMGPLLTVILAIIGLGLLAWLISLIPIPPPFKTAAYVVLIVVLCVIVLKFILGEFPALNSL